MSDFFVQNRSEISQQNQSGFGSFNDNLGASFGKLHQDNQSFGGNGGGSFAQNSGFIVQNEQYRSSVGLEDVAAPIQIYEYQEPQIQKGVFFRSSGDFEMQFEEIGIDRLNIQPKIQEDSKEHKAPSLDSGMKSSQQSSHEFDLKIGRLQIQICLESGEQISSKFKPEVKLLLNSNIIQENKNLFNVNQAKSIYTNKITQLVEQTQKKVDFATKSSPRLSKSQQKLQRKSPIISRDHFDVSSNELQSSQLSPDGNMDPVQQKLAKNRESAKNSRARKKIYYELLETKVKELQDELDKVKESNRNQTKYTEICNKFQEKFQTFLDQQQQLFDKLETCLLKNKDNFEIAMVLDALRYRTNSNSQERNDAARQYFDSMVEVCLPIQTKYLIYALEQDKDFFAQQPEYQRSYISDYTDWMKDVFKKTEIKPEQIVKVKRMKSKLQSVRNTISDHSSSIQNIKVQLKIIQGEANKVDQMWEQLKECLTPVQLGTCLLVMKQVIIVLNYQNAFRQELQTSSIFLQLKNSQMSEEDDNLIRSDQSSIPNNRKLVKKSMQG
ncbi:unnamed protein product (macronuclear) [Paramecium tetraurelia]|uniref:BZIP domain-containing protein n=1 Tax=Paramecium tetraurelia TaxID=5888 RepID=A0BFN3_PARTE|nr:uncharacterized protein GSPATT00028385001 [Paramecium tetraurelia]CAK57350.1 unnamed protein product [Paramecium tetraurelia]|eukprot:XP_001424748.1 hypothetical protein (macronuclear) [Paramecium tetraurelia strain d4-2]